MLNSSFVLSCSDAIVVVENVDANQEITYSVFECRHSAILNAYHPSSVPSHIVETSSSEGWASSD